MSGIVRREGGGVAGPGTPGDAAPASAVPIEYAFGPDSACMEGLLADMPEQLRRAVAPFVDLDRLPTPRWYLERSNGTYSFLAVGESRSVLASWRSGGSVVRRVFESGRLRVLGPSVFPPHPVAGPRGDGPAVAPEDAPRLWSTTFAQLPHESQRLFEASFPPARRATRFAGACMDHDRSRERVWVFGGTRSEVVLVHAHRLVTADPVSPRSTERQLRRASWTVTAWQGRPQPGGSRPEVARG